MRRALFLSLPYTLGALLLMGGACTIEPNELQAPTVPVDAEAPWPKFRGNAEQNGRVDVEPVDDGSEPWVFQTGKGIFSTPVVDGEGNVYIGSADRVFYSIAPDGTERWSVRTGEIIDSSALLDDRSHVYFGSGDGHVYALDRADGTELWRFLADDPADNQAFIRWFEGNVAITRDGTLVAPNDNFCTYGIDRDTGEKKWCYTTADQTWSLPAIDTTTDTLFMGNNFLFGQNVHAFSAIDGSSKWTESVRQSTIAASPMLIGHGDEALVVVGGFDGFLRAFRAADGLEQWSFGARDHIYASPGQLSDGTIVQPAADGTVYGINPDDGSVRWAFDALEPIRSSPAIDAADRIYVGSGEGKLFVLNGDGTLRYSMQLIDDDRNDLNASVALGHRGSFVAGENGGVFFVPFDYCLRPNVSDDRCFTGGEALPADEAVLVPTSRFGAPLLDDTLSVAANEPIVLSLFVRSGGDTQLAALDSDSVQVSVSPEADVRVDVSGDRKFITIVPITAFAAGSLTVSVTTDYLVDLDRNGLKFSGGTRGGTIDRSLTFEVTRPSTGAFALPIPAAPGDPAGSLELYRIAAPLPTILPSYNQIGFDSIHYLVGLIEGTPGQAIAWGIGATPSGPNGETEVDPTSNVRFPLVMRYDDGLLALENEQRFNIEFNGFALPFESFRVRAVTDAMGQAVTSPSLVARAICADIDFYGTFLQNLGFCNPTTDVLLASGAAELRPHAGGTQTAPAGIGTVTVSSDAEGVTAAFADSSLVTAEHNIGLLLVDATTGDPINADYVEGLVRTEDASGIIESATQALSGVSGEVRVYTMVDTYPAAVQTITLP